MFFIPLFSEARYLPLLICGGECLEWSEGSDRLSGERERLLRCLSCDRLEWSDAIEWISEMSDQAKVPVQQLYTLNIHLHALQLNPALSGALTISVRGVG